MRMHKQKYNHGNLNKRLSNLASGFREAMAKKDYLKARECCELVLVILPGNPTVMGDYALTLMRTEAYQQAYDVYLQMYKNREKVQYTGNWLDGLTEVCGWLGKTQELQRYGNESLTLADQGCRDGKQFTFPSQQPPCFEPEKPGQNIISFSLYGDTPKYCETMIKNAAISHEFYPGWTCRVYYDNTVPAGVIARLRAHGVQLVDMSNETEIAPTMWRFLVLDDPGVSRYLLRDADSLFSEKEVAAVEEWLTSPYWFHHMRDYFTHSELLLAGLWGGCRGVFTSVKALMAEFVRQYEGAERYTDQKFLRHVLWPTVRESILNHDETFHFHSARPYPPHPSVRWKTERFHIGSNASYSEMGGTVENTKSEVATVRFESDSHSVNYRVAVHQGQWFLAMPFFLIEDYESGKLKIGVSTP
ncbi:tetratricopeptide repeat protein [Rahnella ecdela]|uniref:Tetratricopeptide repeat protein n=1 Tax=Rahnella ecdela TaxID=2816250 RepID=A0ABS6LA39_9GAMM|nr:tetratricopeptide repeat protein [Rahnella ecdela]MBU9843628.1 tetratricopeptide repeat protein [Rahnella ecdela]